NIQTAGIATYSLIAVATSASEIPPATAHRPVDCSFEIPLHASMMPTTVPNRPTKAAGEPRVANARSPRFRWAWTVASARSSAGNRRSEFARLFTSRAVSHQTIDHDADGIGGHDE